MELPLHSSAPVTTARRTIAGGLHGLRDLAPGLGIAALGVAVSYAAHQMMATVSVLTFAVVVGALLANLPVPLDRLKPGLDFTASQPNTSFGWGSYCSAFAWR
jgi:hypothetical protein